MFGLNPVELMIIGGIAVLLFGSRLPEVARSLGKSLTEFKKGMTDLKSEMNLDSSPRTATPKRYAEIDDRDIATAPKFEPPAAEPQLETVPPEESNGENPPV
jgi:sec-independent protein translocase protein TatA